MAEQLRSDQRGIALMALIIGGAILWFLVVGKSDRVIYQGVDKKGWADPGIVRLATIPSGDYVMAENAMFASLKAGCVYDLNYGVEFGRNRSANRVKTVRSAIFVRC